MKNDFKDRLKKTTKDKTISVRLSQDHYDELMSLVKMSDVTYNHYVAALIEDHIEIIRKKLKPESSRTSKSDS